MHFCAALPVEKHRIFRHIFAKVVHPAVKIPKSTMICRMISWYQATAAGLVKSMMAAGRVVGWRRSSSTVRKGIK